MLRGAHYQRFENEAICYLKKTKLRTFERSLSDEHESERAICRYLRSLPAEVLDETIQLFLKAKNGSVLRGIVIPSEWNPQKAGRFGIGAVKGAQLYHQLKSLEKNDEIDKTIQNIETIVEKAEACLRKKYVQNASLSLFENQKAELIFQMQKFHYLRALLSDLSLHEEVYTVIADWIRYELVRLFNTISKNDHLNPHVYKDEFSQLANEIDELQKWIADDFIFQNALPFLKDMVKDEKPKLAAHKLMTDSKWDNVLLDNVVTLLKKHQVPVMQSSFSEVGRVHQISQDYCESNAEYHQRVELANQRALRLVKSSISNRLVNLGSDKLPESLGTFEVFCKRRHANLDLSAVVQEKQQKDAQEQATSLILSSDGTEPNETIFSMTGKWKSRWVRVGIVLGVIIGVAIACSGFGFIPVAIALGCVAGALAGAAAAYATTKMMECVFGVACDYQPPASPSSTESTVSETPKRQTGLDQLYKKQSVSDCYHSVIESKATRDSKPHFISQPHSSQVITPNAPRI